MRLAKHHKLTALALALASVGVAQALPTTGTFRTGAGTISSSGNTTTVNITGVAGLGGAQRTALINWTDNFSVGAGQTVNFTLSPALSSPTSSLTAVNYDASGLASRIDGTISSATPLQIVLVNPNGVSIGGTARITGGRSFAAVRGSLSLLDSVTGAMNITLLPGDMDVDAGAQFAADYSPYDLGKQTPSSKETINFIADSTGQTLSTPAAFGYSRVNLATAGAQNWKLAAQDLWYGGTVQVAPGSTILVENVPARSTRQLHLEGQNSTVTVRNSGINLKVRDALTAPSKGELFNTDLYIQGGYTGELVSPGVRSLTLSGDNSASKLTVSAFNDVFVQGDAKIGAANLSGKSLAGTAPGWSLTVTPGKTLNLTGAAPAVYGNEYKGGTSTGYFGKSSAGVFNSGTVSGAVTVSPAPLTLDANARYDYTFGPEVQFAPGSSLSVRYGLYSDTAPGAETFAGDMNQIGRPNLVFNGYNGGKAGAGTASLAVFMQNKNGDITVNDSHFTDKVAATQLETAGNLLLNNTSFTTDSTTAKPLLSLAGWESTVVKDSTFTTESTRLGFAQSYAANSFFNNGVSKFLSLENTTISPAADSKGSHAELYGSRIVLDEKSKIEMNPGQSPVPFAYNLMFYNAPDTSVGYTTDSSGYWIYNPGPVSQRVFFADTAKVDLPNVTSGTSTLKPAFAKGSQVVITDPNSLLGAPSATSVAPDAPASMRLPATAGVYFQGASVLIGGTITGKRASGTPVTPPPPAAPAKVTIEPIAVKPVDLVFNPSQDLIVQVLPPAPDAPLTWNTDLSTLPVKYTIAAADIAALVLPAAPAVDSSKWNLTDAQTLPVVNKPLVDKTTTPAYVWTNPSSERWSFSSPAPVLPDLPVAALPAVGQFPVAAPVLPQAPELVTPVPILPVVDLRPFVLGEPAPVLPAVVLDPRIFAVRTEVLEIPVPQQAAPREQRVETQDGFVGVRQAGDRLVIGTGAVGAASVPYKME